MDKWLVLAVDRLLSRSDFGNGYVARCAIRNWHIVLLGAFKDYHLYDHHDLHPRVARQ
jgi:hypothetical protein